jgi:hypothetical protein
MPCDPLVVNRYFGGICRLHLQCRKPAELVANRSKLFSCFAYYLGLKGACSSETSANIYPTARCYAPEDNYLVSLLLNKLNMVQLLFTASAAQSPLLLASCMANTTTEPPLSEVPP